MNKSMSKLIILNVTGFFASVLEIKNSYGRPILMSSLNALLSPLFTSNERSVIGARDFIKPIVIINNRIVVNM